MTKTMRLIESDIKKVDMVIELLDARIPHSSKNPELARLSEGKPRLLLLNKCDLADDAVTEQWSRYYREQGYGIVRLSSKDRKQALRCVDEAKRLMSERLQGLAERGMKGAKIRAMVVGIPNVGKSTFINSISGRAPTKAADRPGVTRGKQWVSLPEIELLDMPGVLWPKLEDQNSALLLAFTGAIKDDVLDTEEVAALLLERLCRRYPGAVSARLKFSESDCAEKQGWELLELAARKRGMLISGGEPDTVRAAMMVLDELRGGKFGRITFEEPEHGA